MKNRPFEIEIRSNSLNFAPMLRARSLGTRLQLNDIHSMTRFPKFPKSLQPFQTINLIQLRVICKVVASLMVGGVCVYSHIFLFMGRIKESILKNNNKEHEYRRVSKVSALLTFEISGLKGRLLSRGRLLLRGAYFQVVIFSIGQG